MLELRDYQRGALDALFGYWRHQGENALIVLPTGAGKALVIAALIKELLEKYPGMRIACVTHTRELIKQNHDELKGYWPGAPAGIYSAGLKRRDTRAKILFCGVQSVHNKVDKLGAFDLIIVDEAHLIPRNAQTQYGRFLADLRALRPDMRLVGLTATPFRLDSGLMTEGDDALFSDVVYDANVADLIKQKYLSPLMSKATALTLDVSGVGKRGGEYIAGQLEDAVNTPENTRAAVEEIIKFGASRGSWLAFCCGVDHARDVRDAIRAAGYACEMVTGDTPAAERDSIIARFKAGRVRCLTSVAVLTTGFNVPAVDMIALLRPTESTGLYVQMIGRGLRKSPATGKENCLVLDFAGCVRKHGPIDRVRAKKPSKGEGPAPTKVCPQCESILPISMMICEDCSHVFIGEDREPKHNGHADSENTILSTELLEPEWVEVDSWAFKRHKKRGAEPGTPDTLRITFYAGFEAISKWLALDHANGARVSAAKTWKRMMAGWDYAPGITEALNEFPKLAPPRRILVRYGGQYPEVLDFEARAFAMAAE